jgi:hypothetical protein
MCVKAHGSTPRSASPVIQFVMAKTVPRNWAGKRAQKPVRISQLGHRGRPPHHPRHAVPPVVAHHGTHNLCAGLLVRSCLFPPRGFRARPGRGLVRCLITPAGPRFATAPSTPRRAACRRGNPQAIQWQSTGFSTGCPPCPPVVAFGTTRHWPVLSCGSRSCPCRHTTARPRRRPHTRSPMRPVPPNSVPALADHPGPRRVRLGIHGRQQQPHPSTSSPPSRPHNATPPVAPTVGGRVSHVDLDGEGVSLRAPV